MTVSGEGKKKKKKKKPKKKKAQQSEPPRVGLSKLFPDGKYPEGEIQEYKNECVAPILSNAAHLVEVNFSNSWRTTSEEKRYLERIALEDPEETYNNIRRAAEVHRQVRLYARRNIKPGMSMTDIVNMIEDGTRALVEENGLESGVGFPTGVSLNNCAAHYTPNAGDTIGEWTYGLCIKYIINYVANSTTAERCIEGGHWCACERQNLRFGLYAQLRTHL